MNRPNFQFSNTNKIFDKTIKILKKLCNDSKILEMLEDISIDRCVLADHDHHSDMRIYMHVNCERQKSNEPHICFSSSAENLPDETLMALFIHEIAHIVAFQYPEIVEDSDEIDLENCTIANITVDNEIMADYIAENILGVRIYYNEDKVQTVLLKE